MKNTNKNNENGKKIQQKKTIPLNYTIYRGVKKNEKQKNKTRKQKI